ncbi:hypothetical protein L7F22_013771 [Adiantum nelumboides]|nr:hypothetical protein [Adiantum nelumboides]
MAYNNDYLYRQQLAPTVCKEEYRGERTYATPPSEGLYAAPMAAAAPLAPRPLTPLYGSQLHGSQLQATPDYLRQERLSELGAVAAAAFAMYEDQKLAKVDPVQAYVQKLDVDAARLGAINSIGYTYNDHRPKKSYDDGRWY